MTSDDWAAIAQWVTAAAVVYAVVTWAWNRRPRGVVQWVKDRYFPPRVSLETGLRAARKATRSSHPPYTATQSLPLEEQSTKQLLGKVAETVWAAASDPAGNALAVGNYLRAISARAGVAAARDFALGVLTERVRQEEDGWPDQPGGTGGKRPAHGADTHSCLLGNKHEVENIIYSAGTPE